MEKITIIGAGNVATHLAIALKNAGYKINQVLSRSINSAKILADKLGAQAVDDVENLSEADLYVISVPDNQIQLVVQNKKFKNKFIVHTSGSIPMNILSKVTDNYGVFYPLQTFRKDKDVDFSNIPICLEASGSNNLQILKKIASKISHNIYEINSEQRLKLHIAAVFVNNFVNHLFAVSAQIVEKENLNFEILRPLIQKTFDNVMKYDPRVIQTGPAVRNDSITLSKHMQILKKYPDKFREIYTVLSDSIQALQNENLK